MALSLVIPGRPQRGRTRNPVPDLVSGFRARALQARPGMTRDGMPPLRITCGLRH